MRGIRNIMLAATLIGLGLGAVAPPTAYAQPSTSARAALAAIEAFSPDEEWTADGQEAVTRVLAASSLDSLRAAAESGNLRAMWMLGHAHYFGLGGATVNNLEATRLWRQAAEGGNLRAQNDVAWMYSNGRGAPQNYAEAARFYQMAANQNHAAAQVDLGVLYENGTGVPQNVAEAARLYDLAAAAGNALGQNNLGVLYERGEGVTQSYDEAMRLYRLSADQGDANGVENLARLGAWMAQQNGAGGKK